MLVYLVAYLVLIWVASRYPDLEVDDPNAPIVRVPEVLPTLMAGLYYLLPVAVLIWCLIVERFSPGLSVSWAIVSIVTVLVTRQPLLVLFRGQGRLAEGVGIGVVDLVQGMVNGARNMVGIAIALAAAGIIVGVVSLTGLGLLMTAIVETISGGYLMLTLIFTAIMCVILGMGLPTTANYIVVVSVMAHTVVTLGAQGGLIVPLIAVHLFVFYFGLISGTTPPVAVDAFAGAAVARSDPLKTCLISFSYDIRTAILPFIFLFNSELLLIGIESWWHFALTVAASVTAMLLFAAATKGYFLTKSRIWESAVLLLLTFTFFRPGFWVDQVYPPYDIVEPMRIEAYVETQPDNANLRLWLHGENFSGDLVRKVALLPLGPKEGTGAERLQKYAGMSVTVSEGKAVVDDVGFNSPTQQWGIDIDWVIEELQVPAAQPAKEWLYIPSLALLGLIVLLQLRRRRGHVETGQEQPA